MATQANTSPITPKLREAFQADVGAVADTSETGAGTTVNLYTAPTDCAFAVVRNLRIAAKVTTTASRLKLFRSVGGTKYKLPSIPISVVSIAAGTEFNSAAVSGANPITGEVPTDIVLAPGTILVAAQHVAELLGVSGEVDVY
jgi:hypothetical protein